MNVLIMSLERLEAEPTNEDQPNSSLTRCFWLYSTYCLGCCRDIAIFALFLEILMPAAVMIVHFLN